MGVWDYVKLVLASDYTLFSAVIAATLGNMAAFGTDQDMVQRMLTAETYKKARRSLITAAFMDLPIAAAFTFIGILLFVYYQQDPTFQPGATADVFGSYILNVMPIGIRGLRARGRVRDGDGLALGRAQRAGHQRDQRLVPPLGARPVRRPTTCGRRAGSPPSSRS